jgi:FkbM family methyltransferase
MDLRFNTASPFTRWVVAAALLEEPFVLIDVGVQGGESVRWHLLGDYLVVHGFDAIKEVVDALTEQNRGAPNRHYHWLAAGSADGEARFYFNAADPFSSSMYQQGKDRFALLERRREEGRSVAVRRLDTLLAEGVVPPADFIKCDVEGYEKDVFAGARELLKSALAVECESNFGISPHYPKSHYGTIQELLLEARLLTIDLNFNRIPRASFVRAAARRGGDAAALADLGKPATLNVLFCREPIAEADEPENYAAPGRPLSIDQLIKTIIIYENYGLPDIALDIAERFAEPLAARLDVEKAIDLLADPSQEQYGSTTPEIQGLKNRIDAHNGRLDGLKQQLAAAESQFAAARLRDVPARVLGMELRLRVRRRLGRLLRPPPR